MLTFQSYQNQASFLLISLALSLWTQKGRKTTVVRFGGNNTFVLLRDLSLEQVEWPSNKTAAEKASVREILFEDELGTWIFEGSDRLLITKQLLPSKGSNTIEFLHKFQCMRGNIDACLVFFFPWVASVLSHEITHALQSGARETGSRGSGGLVSNTGGLRTAPSRSPSPLELPFS